MAYDLKSMKGTPRLAGVALSTFVRALENPVTRALLMPKLLSDAGLKAFRRLTFDDAPSVRPTLPFVGTARQPGAGGTLEALLAAAPTDGRETIASFARAYRSGERTPEDVARNWLKAQKAFELRDPKLRAVTAWDEASILEQARASLDRFRKKAPLGPLDGVPITVKEELDVTGYPTTVGTKFKRTVATSDATVVSRLRAAGAIIVGKSNMHEIGIDTTGFNAHHGTARNPWNPHHYPGGSSSGAGSSVAAGLCPVGIGADGGGSIRIPASYCGVVGLKSTWGRVSETGAAPLCWSVAHVGPLGLTAADVALAWSVIAGPDARDPNSMLQPAVAIPDLSGDRLDGVRLGVYRPWFEHATSDVVGSCDALLKRLEARGARVVEVELPDLEAVRLAHVITILGEMWAAVEADDRTHREDWSLGVRVNLAIAREMTASDYVKAQQVRTRATRHVEKALESCDVIVTPTSAITAPALRPDAVAEGESDLETTIEAMRYVALTNLTGHPAISMPAGFASNGMPIGLQAIGRAWDEGLLLRIAHVAGLVTETRTPAVHAKLL